jgi:hypothetical protein
MAVRSATEGIVRETPAWAMYPFIQCDDKSKAIKQKYDLVWSYILYWRFFTICHHCWYGVFSCQTKPSPILSRFILLVEDSCWYWRSLFIDHKRDNRRSYCLAIDTTSNLQEVLQIIILQKELFRFHFDVFYLSLEDGFYITRCISVYIWIFARKCKYISELSSSL